MNARCTECNKHHLFYAVKGFRLADKRCTCGGKFERLTFHDFDEFKELLYINSKNQIWYLSRDKKFFI